MTAGGKIMGADEVCIWTMVTVGLDEAAVAPWRTTLDAEERARADRFVSAQSRIPYIAAHALARSALAGTAGVAPGDVRFTAGPLGKPQAVLPGGGVPSFSLSHTDGLVGVAVTRAGTALGFDIEPLDRPAPMEVAAICFTAEERRWLDSRPETGRAEGFFRLWTLKEAFVKATGSGLTQDLLSFWFQVHPLQIGFSPGSAEQPADWRFEQRVVPGNGVAALARQAPHAAPARWLQVTPACFNAAAPLPWAS